MKNRKTFIRIVFLLLLCVILSCRKDNPTETKTYLSYDADGYLIDSVTKDPIPNIIVYLFQRRFDGTNIQSEIVASEKTNSSGYFRINCKTEFYVSHLEFFNSYLKFHRELIDTGITHLGNIELPTYGDLGIKLQKNGTFNSTDTLFVIIQNKDDYVFLNYEANDAFYLGNYKPGYLHIKWSFKTPTTTTINKDSIYCKPFTNNIFVLNY